MNLKTGKDILNPNWPDAKWNVSGLFTHDALIQLLASKSASHFDCQMIESVHGSLPVRWNSGRLQNTALNKEKDITTAFTNVLKHYQELGISVFYTFSNSLLEKKDIDDPTCNFMLDRLAEICGDKGGVILSSDLLAEHIRKNYPCLKQIASIVKVTMEDGKGQAAYYRRLEENYDKFVVHPDDNFNPELLRQINTRKAEIIVNETCLINCPTRKQHYLLYSEASKYLKSSLEELHEFENNVCKSVPYFKQVDHQKPWRRNCNLTLSELAAMYEMGFRYFKLQGRTDSRSVFKYDLTRYIFEPDHVGPLMFKSAWPKSGIK